MPLSLSVGTACSGTDVVIGVLRELEAWWSPFGFRSTFSHRFSCDSKASARDFVLGCWSPEAPPVYGTARMDD